ncbi:MAG: caspase family protein, partial [Proteobacteria bacterium]|nr:caspase family protein [Pseudomonadota bacterium]
MLVLSALALTWAGTLPEVDKPLKTGARNGDDAAVVIGIEDYAFVADVPYATRDAQAVYDYLIYTRGVPSSQVRLLNQGASRELILEAVTEAGKQVSDNGVVWVYFAGHGAADPSTGDRILLGDDVRNDPVAFAARALKVDELLSLGGAGGGRVHLLVDACYSGLGRSGEAVLAGKRFAVPTYAVQGPRHLSWNASSGDQLSGP